MSAYAEHRPNPKMDRAETLEKELLELTAHIHAGEYRQLELIAQFDENGSFGCGVRSCAHWMNWRLGIGLGAAREKVRAARCLQQLPLIKEAFRQGKVSYSKVRAMTRVANERNQTFLLDIARYGTASHMERLISHYRRFKFRVGLSTANEQHAARELNYYWDDDGSLVLRGRLPGEVGAVVVKAIEAAWDLAHQPANDEADNLENEVDSSGTEYAAGNVVEETNKNVSAETGRDADESPSELSASDHSAIADAGDRADETNKNVSAETSFERTHIPRFGRGEEPGNHGLVDEPFAAGRADALVMLCERFLALQGQACGSIDPYQVYLHVDTQTLSGEGGDHSHVEAGPELNAHTLRRLCCDTGFILVQEDDAGEVLNVGRKTRNIPPALKRALRLRDQGCRYPGCTQHRHTDAHHIEHWADGGETRLSNLITLCRYHHRLLHEGDVLLTVVEGEYRFEVPELGYLPRSPELTDLTDLNFSLEDLNQREGLDINPKTGDCQWTGESLDWDTGIEALMKAEFPQGTEWHQGWMRPCKTMAPTERN